MEKQIYGIQQDQTCPIVEAIRVVGNENDLIVIRHLIESDLGFNDLLHRFNGISPKTLSMSLKRLQERGLITRTVISTQPFRIRYSLTEKGRDLQPVLTNLRDWGNKWVLNSPEGGMCNDMQPELY
ncbi:MAG: helix-turn-helix transcriptional regulator [Candidatus Thermoplasmatota archaeon]|nr:helix-turn-helix transcriptional regulator [Candidatus Thermoplasmatota archaeon]MCL5730844.1 helix-turn-helix transcriptional regulator [Candidatus Thermoplasmatota archaeon]